MTSITQNDHLDGGNTLRHVGLARPKRPKNYRSTTIIVTDGEEVKHKPVSTEDLYAKPDVYSNLDDVLSNENGTEVKLMKNRPMAGFALPVMDLSQVKLRSTKSADSPQSNGMKGESSETEINGKDGVLSQSKLKKITPTATEDTVKSIPAEQFIQDQQNIDDENQNGDCIRPSLLKNNPFMLAEMKRREQKKQIGLAVTVEPQQNRKSELPSQEIRSSNQNNSEYKLLTSPSNTPKKSSVETSHTNGIDFTSFTNQPVPRQISQLESSTTKVPLKENSEASTQFGKSSSSSSPTDNSDSTGSSYPEDKITRNGTQRMETHFREFSCKSATTERKSHSENDSATNVQLRHKKVPDNEERKGICSSYTRKSVSSRIVSENNCPDPPRKLCRLNSLPEGAMESDRSVPRSESKKEIERASRKSHSPAISTASGHSKTSTSSKSTTSSKAHSEASSGKRIYQKSGNASRPRKLSSSSSASGSSSRDKTESKNHLNNSNSSSVEQKVMKRRSPPKSKDNERSEVTSESKGTNDETPTAPVRMKRKSAAEQNEKFHSTDGADCNATEVRFDKTPERRTSIGDRLKLRYRKRRNLKPTVSSTKTSKNPNLDQEYGAKISKRKTFFQRSMPNLSNIPEKPVKKPRRKFMALFLRKKSTSIDTADEHENEDNWPQQTTPDKLERSLSLHELDSSD